MANHKHHIVPRHMGGTDDPSNLETITVEEHAERHYQLWLICGHWEDELAYMMLTGRIRSEDGCREAVRRANKERVWSEEAREKCSRRMKGNSYGALSAGISRHFIEGHPFLGKIRPEHSSLMKERGIIPPNMKGQSWTQTKVICPHCKKTGGKANMLRYHFDNCKAI